tara:strand:- start:290 stop:1900 length:1611 start_codon:yes stop_codon:yes gene_type:complete
MVNFLSVASSIFIMVVYDRVIPNAAYSSLYALTVGMLIVFIFDFILKNLRAWFIDEAGHQLDLEIGEDIFHTILNAKFDKSRASIGEKANILKEFDLVKDFFTSASLVILVDLPFISLFIFVIYLIGGSIAIVPLTAIPIVFIVGISVQPFLERYNNNISKSGKEKYGLIIESLNGQETIIANNSSNFFMKKFNRIITLGADSSRKSKVLSQLATNIASSSQLLSLVGIIFYGTFLIDEGTLSMGALVACVLLSSRALAPLAQASNLFGRLNAAKMSYKKIDHLMREFEEVEKNKPSLAINEIKNIEIRNLDFHYPGDSRECLNNINLKINFGEKIAIMGKNGSGKTTLIKILAGLYSPTKGSLSYNNVSFEQIDQDLLSKRLGTLLQECKLFSGTIKENILLGRKDIDERSIDEAMDISGLKAMLINIPSGIDAVLSDGGESLSAGQRQAISIARLLVTKPEILLLDEPTSTLDINAEQDFVAKISKSNIGSMIIVTHRLPILKVVDRIIVLAEGSIVIDGPKNDVLEKLKLSKE